MVEVVGLWFDVGDETTLRCMVEVRHRYEIGGLGYIGPGVDYWQKSLSLDNGLVLELGVGAFC